jgi:hypothetical protein
MSDYEQFTERMTSFDLTLSPEGEPLQHYDDRNVVNMGLDADAYMARYGIEPGSELVHYGKKGMKWGVRKARPDRTARAQAHRAAGAAKVAKYGSNAKTKAAAMEVGKFGVRNFMLSMAQVGINKIPSAPLRGGAIAVNQMLGIANTVRTVQNIHGIAKSDQEYKPKGD